MNNGPSNDELRRKGHPKVLYVHTKPPHTVILISCSCTQTAATKGTLRDPTRQPLCRPPWNRPYGSAQRGNAKKA